MKQHRARILWASLVLFSASCVPFIPTPDDFPQPPWTPIVEFPTASMPPTQAPRPFAKPIYPEDMDGARTFFLILRVGMSAGDSAMIAQRVLYPINVRVNGKATTINSAAEFEDSYEQIFSPAFQQMISAGREEDLVLLPDGVQAASGALWFGLFCLDTSCAEPRFLITEINN